MIVLLISNNLSNICFYLKAQKGFPSSREGHVMVTTKHGVVMFGGEDLRLVFSFV